MRGPVISRTLVRTLLLRTSGITANILGRVAERGAVLIHPAIAVVIVILVVAVVALLNFTQTCVDGRETSALISALV